MTLFVNKAPIASPEHGTLTWGAAQAGVASGAADAVAGGLIEVADCDHLLVNPDASDAELVYANNRAATLAAIRAGLDGLPRVSDVLAARHLPSNPYYTAREGNLVPKAP